MRRRTQRGRRGSNVCRKVPHSRPDSSLPLPNAPRRGVPLNQFHRRRVREYLNSSTGSPVLSCAHLHAHGRASHATTCISARKYVADFRK